VAEAAVMVMVTEKEKEKPEEEEVFCLFRGKDSSSPSSSSRTLFGDEGGEAEAPAMAEDVEDGVVGVEEKEDILGMCLGWNGMVCF